MNFRCVNHQIRREGWRFTDRTSFTGIAIEASRRELTCLFGEHVFGGDDTATSTEWVFEGHDPERFLRLPFTVYDWNVPSPGDWESQITFNVGAKGRAPEFAEWLRGELQELREARR